MENTKRKIWVKRIAIVFLVVLLILTFFSNTIMNHSLAVVSTKEVTSDKVSSKVRGSGTVESLGEKDIKIEESREVVEVLVKEGDTVQVGDVLLRLKEGSSSELTQAKEELAKLKETYQNNILLNEISKDIVTKAENGGINYQTSARELQELSAKQEQAQKNLDDLQEKLKEAENSASSVLEDLEDSLMEENSSNAEVERLTKEVEKANKELTSATETHSKYIENLNTINDLKSQYESIKEKEEEISKIERNSIGSEIKSEIAGTVSAVNVNKGETTTPDVALLTIQEEGKGYTLSFEVTKEQAAKVKKGDEAEVNNSWYYGDVTAILSTIKASTTQPGKSKVLTFDITGEDLAGEELTLSLGEKSCTYDYVVPNSAVREDKNGKFILIIKEKSTPLGNRYIATRIDVEVVIADDSNTAVTGTLDGGEYVITTSNKVVNEGDYVRLSK